MWRELRRCHSNGVDEGRRWGDSTGPAHRAGGRPAVAVRGRSPLASRQARPPRRAARVPITGCEARRRAVASRVRPIAVPAGTAAGSPADHPAGRGGNCREAYLSTQRAEAGQAPRFPSPHGRPCRSSRDQGASAQGSGTTVGLIGSIRDRATFDALRRRGRRVRSGPIWVVHFADPSGAVQDPPVRIGFAIGRKVGGAVVRNRLRRRLRSIVLEAARTPGSIPPGAYLIGVRPDAATASFAELRTRMLAALRELKDPGS